MAGRNKVIFALVDGNFSEWGNKLRSTEKTIPSLYANTMNGLPSRYEEERIADELRNLDSGVIAVFPQRSIYLLIQVGM